MRHVSASRPWLALALGSCILPEAQVVENACVSFIIDDELMSTEPADVFPQDGFDILWFDRYVLDPPDGGDPDFDNVLESLSLRDPVTDAILVQLDDRVVAKPMLLDVPGGQSSKVSFSEFTSHPAYDPVPRDYTFHVEIHTDPADEVPVCPDGARVDDGIGELALTVPCDCDGHYSYGLRVEGAGTSPASPITEGTFFELTWVNVYDGVHCESVAPVESGDFQVSIQINGPPGALDPVLVDVASLSSDTSVVQSVDIADLIPVMPPAGAYDVTLILDAGSVVPECASQGDVDTTDQTVMFSFEIVP